MIDAASLVNEKCLLDHRSYHERHHVEPHGRLHGYMFHPSEVFPPFSVRDTHVCVQLQDKRNSITSLHKSFEEKKRNLIIDKLNVNEAQSAI